MNTEGCIRNYEVNMKLHFRLELFSIREDYSENTGYLITPREGNIYDGQAAYVTKRVYDKYLKHSNVWKQYHRYKKL